jgi:hypothetical protein
MKYLLILIVNIFLYQSIYSQTKPILKIGLVADPQYADQPINNKRHYRESLWKLEEAIDTFNSTNVDFVQNLGDIIDKEWSSFDSILPIYDKLNPEIENYQLLGNHDYSVDSIQLEYLLGKLNMLENYYSYSKKDWKFIVLDATDYAYYSNVLHKQKIDLIDLYYKNIKDQPNHQPWNGAIGEVQQKWLIKELESAKLLNQKVILFSHIPLRPINNSHNLWNDFEILEIIENSPNVIAFINGHNHAGGYVYKNGIHYITMFGMVDTKISSFGILEIYKDRMELRGYGNQEKIILEH